MIEKEKVSRIVEEQLAISANYLVDVTVKPGNLIIVEIDNDEGVNIDDCAELSRYIESRLNREEEDYELEVGSAGITTPFKTFRQYLKNVGKEVECVLKSSGVKQTGILKSADESGIVMAIEKQVKPEGAKRKQTIVEEQAFPYGDIKYTKCVIRFK
ncbi:ribosome maturation factor RimP [Bacteroidia bacterium]|nr:ribosome maturation factor RimP [Bacteroidia bacterium]